VIRGDRQVVLKLRDGELILNSSKRERGRQGGGGENDWGTI
jgi:hypothetical protein